MMQLGLRHDIRGIEGWRGVAGYGRIECRWGPQTLHSRNGYKDHPQLMKLANKPSTTELGKGG